MTAARQKEAKPLKLREQVILSDASESAKGKAGSRLWKSGYSDPLSGSSVSEESALASAPSASEESAPAPAPSASEESKAAPAPSSPEESKARAKASASGELDSPEGYPGISGFMLIIWVLLSLVALSLKNVFPSGSDEWLSWSCLPWQLVWTTWQLKINHLVGRRLNKRPPVSPWEIVFVSVLSFFFRPPYFMELDPAMWIWIVSQLWFYLRVAPHVLAEAGGKPRWRAGIELGLLATAFASIGVVFCHVISPALGTYFHSLGIQSLAYSNYIVRAYGPPEPAVFGELISVGTSVLFQSVALAILTLKLGKGGKKRTQELPARDARKQVARNTEQISVPYQALAGIERFFKQSSQAKGRSLGETMLLGFALPLALTAYLIWAYSFLGLDIGRHLGLISHGRSAQQLVEKKSFDNGSNTTGALRAKKAPVMSEQEIMEKGVNRLAVTSFLSLLAALFCGGVFFYFTRPAQIVLGRKGLRLLRRDRLLADMDWVDWKTITRIALSKKPGRAGAIDSEIVFARTGTRPIGIPLGALETAEQKEALLDGIKLFGAGVPREPSLEEALARPLNHSYTELWLKALSAAPRRERLKPLAPGSYLSQDKYKVEKSIGAGGQGHAYLALDNENSCPVVLKEFILPVYVDLDVRKSALAQFENEARILQSLHHEQVVQLKDFFVEDHRAYLVLEHIEGVSLRQLVREKGQLSEPELICLAWQMCAILKYLHAQSPPVIHRDFTPDNLILRQDGTLKLIDFNVAKQSDGGSLGTVVGKHAYMPPEQFRGEAVAQSDIYSLGASLFFAASGKDPEAISQSSLKGLREDISQGLSLILEKASAPAIEERFASVSEMEAALEDL